VSTEVLPITAYRPGLAEYPEVSAALQQATLDVVTGTSVEDAVATFDGALKGIVGADNVAGG
jgi:multiple sugar transport system substrate-binding protein